MQRHQQYLRPCQFGNCRGECGRQLDRARELAYRLLNIRHLSRPDQGASLEKCEVSVRSKVRVFGRSFMQSDIQLLGDAPRDLVLYREHIIDGSVDLHRPQFIVGRRIDQLCVNPQCLACALHTAFDEIARAKLAPYITCVRRGLAERE